MLRPEKYMIAQYQVLLIIFNLDYLEWLVS